MRAIFVIGTGRSKNVPSRSRQDHTFGEQILWAMRHTFWGHVERPSGG